MKQVHLQNSKTKSQQIVWVDDNPKVKKGNHMTFKDASDDVWNILDVWYHNLDKQELHKTWHHGGL